MNEEEWRVGRSPVPADVHVRQDAVAEWRVRRPAGTGEEEG